MVYRTLDPRNNIINRFMGIFFAHNVRLILKRNIKKKGDTQSLLLKPSFPDKNEKQVNTVLLKLNNPPWTQPH